MRASTIDRSCFASYIAVRAEGVLLPQRYKIQNGGTATIPVITARKRIRSWVVQYEYFEVLSN